MSHQQPGPQPYGPPPGQVTGWGQPPQQPPKKSKAVPIIIGVVSFVVVIGIIAAVAGGGGKKSGTTTSSAPQAAPAGTTTAAAKAPAKPAAPAKKATAAYGDTYTYTDGLAITVSKVGKYTPSQYAAGTHPGDEAVVLTVKVTNGEKKPFDTSLVGVNVKAGADGAAAEQIFDDTSGIGFSGTIVPGATATARFGFDIPKGAAGKLDIEVAPDSGLAYASWHWVGPMP